MKTLSLLCCKNFELDLRNLSLPEVSQKEKGKKS